MKTTSWNWAGLIAVCALWVGLQQNTHAQQIPLYSQHFHNQFIFNPAWAGLHPFGSANLTHRAQWTGLEEGPQTTLFSYDMPFYEQRSGAGITLYQDRLKFNRRFKLMGTYAYHIIGEYENSSTLSFGLSGGIVHNRMDLSDLFVRHYTDPYIFGNTGRYTGFEVAFGMLYNFKNKLQLGLSAPQLLNAGFSFTDENQNNIRLVNHFLLSIKGDIGFNSGYSKLEPMLMVRQVLNAPIQLDFGAQYSYRDIVRVSAAYRTQYAITLCAGFNYERLSVGMARDFPISDMVGSIGSTNEIMIGYKFNYMPGADWAGKAGQGNGLLRKKKYHPSRPGPGMDRHPKAPKKKKLPKRYRRW
jgi:type IX secretion system PorP/SprF family membrane protein